MDGGRNTSNNPTEPFNPRLSSNFNLNYTQPLLRNFSIDSTREQLRLGQKQQACSAYSQVDTQFPKATEARKRAQAELKRAGC